MIYYYSALFGGVLGKCARFLKGVFGVLIHFFKGVFQAALYFDKIYRKSPFPRVNDSVLGTIFENIMR